MTGTLPSAVLLMGGMGFMGSLHCIGMCGGLIGALSMSRKGIWWPGLLAYQFGRVTTYSLLGLLVGISGAALSAIGGDTVQRVLAAVAGLLMLVFALNLAGWLPDPLRRIGAVVSHKTGLSRLAMRASGSARPGNWYALGMINGLLPCGLVYAALAMVLAAGDALQGTLMMAAFGLGTIPAMMAIPSLLRGMTPSQRGLSMRIAAVLIMLLGLMVIYRSTLTPQAMHGHHAAAGSYLAATGLAKVSIGSISGPSLALRPTLS